MQIFKLEITKSNLNDQENTFLKSFNSVDTEKVLLLYLQWSYALWKLLIPITPAEVFQGLHISFSPILHKTVPQLHT